MPDSQPQAPKESSRRERLRQKPGPKPGTSRASSPPSPTRSIEPGHVHYRMAGEVLKAVQARAAEAGHNLDVGELPDLDTTPNGNGDDPTRLVGIVARIIARGGDRIGPLRKISRHLEGSDKRSGILSDMAAAVIELYKRNPDTFHELGKQSAQNFNARRMQRAAEAKTNPNGGMTNAPR